MKFYDVDESVRAAIGNAESRLHVRIAIDFPGSGELVELADERILEARFRSLKEVGGGVVNSGSLLLDNCDGAFSPERFGDYLPEADRYNGPRQEDGLGNLRPGRAVLVSFSAGEGNRFVPRFLFYVDERGFRQELSKCCRDEVRLGLVDRSHVLRKSDQANDWTESEVFAYLRVCDKANAPHSLVHRIAARGKLIDSDIDCCTIDAEIPYLKTALSVWDELCACASAYFAHLETAVEKPLVFAHSPYQREPAEAAEIQYVLGNENLFSLTRVDCGDEFRNDIRLKWNKCVPCARQRLWSYSDPPVVYGADLAPTYPFSAAGHKREIESTVAEYTASYRASGADGKPRTVLYADELDAFEEVEARMKTSGPGLAVAAYNPGRYPDRAVIRLECTADAALEELSIWGRPIAVEPNFACYLRDEESVARYGTRVLNVSGKYFSDTLYEGVPQYEDWVARTLGRLCRMRRRYIAKTNRPIFHARVGALVSLNEVLLGSGIENRTCEIEEIAMRYRKQKAFVTSFALVEA